MPHPGRESHQVLALGSPAVERRAPESGATLLWVRQTDGPVTRGTVGAAGPLEACGGTPIPWGVRDAACVPAVTHGEEVEPSEALGEGASSAGHGEEEVVPVKESVALQGAKHGHELALGLDLRLELGFGLDKAVAGVLQQACGAQG